MTTPPPSRTRTLRTGVLAVVATAAVLTSAACSGTTPADAGSGSAPGSSANPNAPEVNPSGDIPDNQAFVEHTAPAGFALQAPEGWAQTDTATGLMFNDKLNSITATSTSGASAPTEASARAAADALGAAGTGYSPGATSTVSRTAGQVVLDSFSLDSPPDPVTGRTTSSDVELYQFFRSGLRVTLVLTSPHGADNVDPWKTVTDSVRFTA